MVYVNTIHMKALFLTVDHEDRRPIYQQVAEGIKALMAQGRLTEGSELPAVRQLAADLGVNLNTIATAYRELAEEGLIYVRHGLRAVVAGRTLAQPNRSDLRKRLRPALAELALTGLSRSQILGLVAEELRGMAKK